MGLNLRAFPALTQCSSSHVISGMKVNLDATRTLFDVFRSTCPGIKVVYTSSQAVYGGEIPEPVTEKVRPTPEGSYGCQKLICESLINEYHRRGFVDAIVLRLPTITVRPGKPTAAASSFLSGMIREPMQGLPCVIPVQDRSFYQWLCSPRTLSSNLLHALHLPTDALPSYDRVLNAPGIGASIQDMMDSLARVGGQDRLQYLSEKEDPAMKAILYSWPRRFDNSLALGLGFVRDESTDIMVKDFKDSLVSPN